jgi:hypothetical protein
MTYPSKLRVARAEIATAVVFVAAVVSPFVLYFLVG